MQNLARPPELANPASPSSIRLRNFCHFLAFLCFIFYQFGPSYHLSFGSFGLFLLIILIHPRYSKSSLAASVTVVACIFISYFFHINNYGDNGELARIGRFAFNAFFLFLLFNTRNSLQSPPPKLIIISIVSLLIFVTYQNIYNPAFRLPASWFALSAESDPAGEMYVATKESLRASGPYSEPSVLGMVFCCLYAFGSRLQANYRKLSTLLCTFGILLSGSLLGLVGFGALYFSKIKGKKTGIKSAALGLLALSLLAPMLISLSGYGLAVFDRTYDESQLFDVSTQARLIKPFSLILEIFFEYNFFGFPGDIYSHYLGTGIYDSQGNFPGHNGFLGLVMSFGLFGIWFVWLVFKQTITLEEGILLLIIGSQNGNFFSYEKTFLIIFVILSIRGMRRSQFSIYSNKSPP